MDLRWILAALLLSAGMAGCTQGDPSPPEPEWVEVVVPARQMLDLEFTLSSGAVLSWEWESTGPVAFQALYVTGASAYPLASAYGNASEDERTTPQSGRYDLTWDNQRPEDILVRFIVPEGATHKLWPAGSGGPGCPPPQGGLLARMC